MRICDLDSVKYVFRFFCKFHTIFIIMQYSCYLAAKNLSVTTVKQEN